MSKFLREFRGLLSNLYIQIFVWVVLAYPSLKIMGFEGVATAFVFSYIAVYGISVIENLGQLGIPVPEFLKSRFSKLKDTSEKQGEENGGEK
ncbi:phage holin family protein [Enterococcus sp. DIV0660C]|uniref:phage holin family protein n=1 Tax=Enterococcus sp. DIV0660C TaxID=2230880 RepID=UPI003242AEC9